MTKHWVGARFKLGKVQVESVDFAGAQVAREKAGTIWVPRRSQAPATGSP